MAVFTSVSKDELTHWLQAYAIGSLVGFEGIATGIENTNFFVTTTRGRYVLTLFEKLSRAELQYYLNLMAHFARHGIPSPAPIADHENRLLGELNGKPAAIVTRLAGKSEMQPAPSHCAAAGAMLAHMHLAGQSFDMHLENPRGPNWWRAIAPLVRPFLDQAQSRLLEEELAFQAQHRRQRLPRGVVHADLFRDNVLFTGGEIGGVFDFYFAGDDVLLFDVAVCANDWCVGDGGELDADRTRALLAAYHAVRPFGAEERAAWPLLLRSAALRFWLSRLYDLYAPRPGEIVHPHDPERFRRILELRRADVSPPWLG
jgi:homoserine kinase type II